MSDNWASGSFLGWGTLPFINFEHLAVAAISARRDSRYPQWHSVREGPWLVIRTTRSPNSFLPDLAHGGSVSAVEPQ